MPKTTGTVNEIVVVPGVPLNVLAKTHAVASVPHESVAPIDLLLFLFSSGSFTHPDGAVTEDGFRPAVTTMKNVSLSADLLGAVTVTVHD